MRNRSHRSLFLLVLLVVVIGSCQTSRLDFYDQIARDSENAKLNDLKFTNPDGMFFNRDLLNTSVSLFTVVKATSVPHGIIERINDRLGRSIGKTGFFRSVVSDSEQRELFRKDRSLDQKKGLYLDTLASVAVSDKDISYRMGRYLGVENFLVFQLDQWPCVTCSQKNFRMKLRLVEPSTGYLIWTAIVEMKALSKEELDSVEEISLTLVDKLSDRFYHLFKSKWHLRRYDHLSELAFSTDNTLTR